MQLVTYLAKLQAHQDRDERARKLRRKGWTLQQIADKYKITKARAGQICDGVKRGRPAA